MALFNKFHQFTEDLAHKVHNLGSDQIVVALLAAANAPSAADDAVLADVTQASYTFCSTRNVTTASSNQTAGVHVVSFTDLTLTSTGGSTGPFRYVVLYNDTASGDPLIGWYDYGTDVTIANGETFLIDFAASSLTIT
jgi:hypothetical protein